VRREAIGAIVGGVLGFGASSALFGPRVVHAVELGMRGAAADAVITGTSRDVPGRSRRVCVVWYSFRADGPEYQAEEDSCPAEIGRHRPVHYLPDDPSVSTLRTPLGAVIHALMPIVFLTPFGAAFGWALLRPGKAVQPRRRR
jgi:hypothetical protein